MDSLEQVIARHPFFNGLDPAHLPLLAADAQRVRFAPGQVIVREGEEARQFCLVLKGRVSLEALIPARGQVGFQEVTGGEALGWSWLFPPYRSHFTACAVEETEAVAWDSAQLRARAEANPKLGYDLASRMTKVLLQRLQATHGQMLDFYGQTG
jgi:CRP-like cAMP-binding protein